MQHAEAFYPRSKTTERMGGCCSGGVPWGKVHALTDLGKADNVVDALFGLEMEEEFKCEESDESKVSKSTAKKLVCNIQGGAGASTQARSTGGRRRGARVLRLERRDRSALAGKLQVGGGRRRGRREKKRLLCGVGSEGTPRTRAYRVARTKTLLGHKGMVTAMTEARRLPPVGSVKLLFQQPALPVSSLEYPPQNQTACVLLMLTMMTMSV